MWSTANFKSFLAQDFKAFLEFRRGYGIKAVADRDNLRVFDQYVVKKGVAKQEEFTPYFFMEMMAQELETKVPRTIRMRLRVLNHFFRYLQRCEKIQFNPVEELVCKQKLYYAPAIFSVDEIKKILEHNASQITHKEKKKYFFLTQLSRYTAIYIQAACGMRISEVCNLKKKNYDGRAQTLFIEKTKFRKDRLIPISEWCDAAIGNYLETRKSLLNDDNPSLLITYWKNKWDRKTLDHYFRKSLKELGMYKKPEIKGKTIFGSPSTHSLRHSFAVNTLKRWKREGWNIDSIADALATYMGHVDFTYTQTYLTALEYDPQLLVFDLDDKQSNYKERIQL